jgi:hypothetical protein
MKLTHRKIKGMKRQMFLLPIFLVGLVALTLGTAAPESWAAPLSDTAIYIEINDTDGDAGIQIFLDGEGWDSMEVFDPNGNRVLNVTGEGGVGQQGITELFFESAEPSFDEQPLEDLLELFPEGFYRFEGTTTEGAMLKGKARLTHDLPAAPVIVSPEEDDDSVDPGNTVIEWEPVADPPGSTIVGYHVVVEREMGSSRVFTVDLGPTATSVTVPAEFMESNTAYKFEVLAIETSGNQTISEGEFETE